MQKWKTVKENVGTIVGLMTIVGMLIAGVWSLNSYIDDKISGYTNKLSQLQISISNAKLDIQTTVVKAKREIIGEVKENRKAIIKNRVLIAENKGDIKVLDSKINDLKERLSKP